MGQLCDTFHQRSMHPLQKTCLQDRVLQPPLDPTSSRQIVQEFDAAGTDWRKCPGRSSIGSRCCSPIGWTTSWYPESGRALRRSACSLSPSSNYQSMLLGTFRMRMRTESLGRQGCQSLLQCHAVVGNAREHSQYSFCLADVLAFDPVAAPSA
jgi:hypothetical protein